MSDAEEWNYREMLKTMRVFMVGKQDKRPRGGFSDVQ